ncbi:hypothetical protein P9112_012501 [Eukaryota sp. TZLM1-RC]
MGISPHFRLLVVCSGRFSILNLALGGFHYSHTFPSLHKLGSGSYYNPIFLLHTLSTHLSSIEDVLIANLLTYTSLTYTYMHELLKSYDQNCSELTELHSKLSKGNSILSDLLTKPHHSLPICPFLFYVAFSQSNFSLLLDSAKFIN